MLLSQKKPKKKTQQHPKSEECTNSGKYMVASFTFLNQPGNLLVFLVFFLNKGLEMR